MRRRSLPMYAVALAVLIVGLAAVGVPFGSLLIVPLILVCPLMMMWMMRGMAHGGGGPGSGDSSGDRDTVGTGDGLKVSASPSRVDTRTGGATER